MKSINIEEDKLKKMLEEAYEAGWSGCIELKDHSIKNILNNFYSLKNNFIDENIYCNPNMFITTTGGEGISINTNDLTIDQLNDNQSNPTAFDWMAHNHNLLFGPES